MPGFNIIYLEVLPVQLEILAEQNKFVVSGTYFTQG